VLDPHAVSMFVCAYECAGWLLIPLLSVAAIEVSARERRAVMGRTRQGIGLKVERPLMGSTAGLALGCRKKSLLVCARDVSLPDMCVSLLLHRRRRLLLIFTKP